MYFKLLNKKTFEKNKMSYSINNWKSIYNNLYPGLAFPSISSLLIIIFSILFVGYPVENKHYLQYSNSSQNEFLSSAYNSKDKVVQKLGCAEMNGLINSTSFTAISFSTIKKKDQSDYTITDISANNNCQLGVNKSENINNELVIKNEFDKSSNNIFTKNGKREVSSFVKKQHDFYDDQVSFQLYANQTINAGLAVSKNIIPNNINENNKPAFNYFKMSGLVAGGLFSLKLSTLLRFNAGMQFNFTNYKITPTDNISLENDDVAFPTIGNDLSKKGAQLESSDADALSQSSCQLSIPIGAEVKLAQIDKVTFITGATIQPSLLLSGKKSINISDISNSLSDFGTLRKWNLNTSVETFLRYKLNKNVMINAGTEMRYQLLSTIYSKYFYNEKLYNIGLKMGITTSF